jgi:hypothetical protein
MITQKEISERILFGDENPTKVTEKVLAGNRSTYWNSPGHPDHTTWVKLIAARPTPKTKGGIQNTMQ